MGWQSIASSYPDIEIDFFGAANSNLQSLTLHDGFLVTDEEHITTQFAMTANGKTSVELAAYDGFGICIGLSFSSLMLKLGGQRVYGMPGLHPETPLVSERLAEHMAQQAATHSGGLVLARKIRRGTRRPIVACTIPAPTRGIAAEEASVWENVEAVHALLEPKWWNSVNAITRRLRVVVIPQPQETIEGTFTAEHFARGGYIQLRAGDRQTNAPDDHWHMNADYGAIIIPHMLRAMRRRVPRKGAQPDPPVVRSRFARAKRVLARIWRKPS